MTMKPMPTVAQTPDHGVFFESHGRFNTSAVFDGRYGSTVSEVACDKFQIVYVYIEHL